MASSTPASFFSRHEFLILRLHSLSGLMPVGGYMVIHLLTNASMLAGPKAFQRNVDSIHALGPALPLVEWTFIFLPLLFHIVVGVMIVRSGKANASRYAFAGNIRYTLQRATAWIALVFIFWHVFHMHGWIHNDYWMNNLAKPLYGGQFDPEHATSSVALALAPPLARLAYAIGIVSCVYHFANGLWTMGITWGVWETAAAQRRANWLCATIGVLLLAVGLGALFGATRVNVLDAEAYETAKIDQENDLLKREEEIKSKLEAKSEDNKAAAQPLRQASTAEQADARP